MSARRQPLPERPRRYRIALTPLADAMFQLLIFFMLTTSLTPYSLITLKSVSDDAVQEDTGGPGAGDGPSQANSTGTAATIWEIGNDIARIAGQTYGMDQLADLALAIGTQDQPGQVVLQVGLEARVQDVAFALEALENANIDAVQITREATQ
ncbi:MAG: ExbD/TolR family protein [Marivita sp.]|uniref:ExbD/TolR family protein n=1 Tax=Marivita sp. TaxID=2003365 RepID=UPI003EF7407E